jgi:peptidoglycan/xylan/chitin deacetylase (PgdA/CDA1 family)
MYHRVDEVAAQPDLDPSLLSATLDGFRRQIAHLSRTRHLVSLDEVIAARRGEASLPPGSVMVTFDDAYEDFGRNAWPVLREHGAPVTLFVPTAFPDSSRPGFWWDRLHRAFRATARRAPVASGAGTLPLGNADDRAASFARLRDHVKAIPHDDAMGEVDAIVAALEVADSGCRVLGWQRLRELAGEGVALAPHSRTHPILSRLPVERVAEELIGSWDDLEREIGPTPRAFAYPAGGHSREVVDVLGRAGFEVAFTTERGTNDLRDARWLELSRRNVGVRSGLDVLRLQLAVPGLRAWVPTR